VGWRIGRRGGRAAYRIHFAGLGVADRGRIQHGLALMGHIVTRVAGPFSMQYG
jgi:hypothetical protein